MEWKKSPPELVDTFEAVMPGPPAVRRSLFGYPAGFVNGNMFMGLYQEDFIVRLGDAERRDILGVQGAHVFEPMPGRPMKEYVALPRGWLSDRRRLSSWVKKALDYGASLPPKSKPKARRTTGKAAARKRAR